MAKPNALHFQISEYSPSLLDETKPQYKNAKEAASQLGLGFEEELK